MSDLFSDLSKLLGVRSRSSEVAQANTATDLRPKPMQIPVMEQLKGLGIPMKYSNGPSLAETTEFFEKAASLDSSKIKNPAVATLIKEISGLFNEVKILNEGRIGRSINNPQRTPEEIEQQRAIFEKIYTLLNPAKGLRLPGFKELKEFVKNIDLDATIIAGQGLKTTGSFAPLNTSPTEVLAKSQNIVGEGGGSAAAKFEESVRNPEDERIEVVQDDSYPLTATPDSAATSTTQDPFDVNQPQAISNRPPSPNLTVTAKPVDIEKQIETPLNKK